MFTQSIFINRRVSGVVAPYSTVELFTYHTILRQQSWSKSKAEKRKIYIEIDKDNFQFSVRRYRSVQWVRERDNIYFCTWNRILLFCYQILCCCVCVWKIKGRVRQNSLILARVSWEIEMKWNPIRIVDNILFSSYSKPLVSHSLDLETQRGR